MTPENVFDLISREFPKNKIPCVLIGGFAVNNHKVSRQTVDVDFMINDANSEKAITTLKNAGYQLVNLQDAFAQFKSKDPAYMDLDLMFVDSPTFNEISKAGIKITLFGHDFFVPRVEHLIALKLHALKNNFSYRQDTDLPDIRKLVEANGIDPKSDPFKDLCLKYGNADIYRLILRTSEKP